MSMVGRRVKSWTGEVGEVVRWEPLGSAMTDVLVQLSDGRQMWFGSGSLKSVDGRGPLPSRREAQEQADALAHHQLQHIYKAHVRDFHRPWPGAEHGKAIVGKAIVGALGEVEGRLKKRHRYKRSR